VCVFSLASPTPQARERLREMGIFYGG
jgi:hypothetical protein